MQYDVVIPAGGHLDQHFADVVGTKSKALIGFQGTTILGRTIKAFRETGAVRRIAVVGTQEVLDHADVRLADLSCLERGSSPKNIMAGFDLMRHDGEEPERALICTADLPFITPNSIQAFLSVTGKKDFYAPLITEESYFESFRDSPATFVRLKDGSYTAGCLYNVNTASARKSLEYMEEVFKQRKSKMGMANILGVGFLIRYIFRMVKVEDVERRVSELLHCTASGILGSNPELAFDIDHIDDYYYAIQNYSAIQKGKWSPVNSD